MWLVAVVVACMSACSSTPVGMDPVAGDLGDAGRNGTEPDTICLLNNCDVDGDCANCTDGRRTCLQSERRCIACQPGSNDACKSGQYCTKYGDCVPTGTKCDEDVDGNPTGTCTTDADCKPCNPKHRVCDTTSQKCVGCLPGKTSNCQSTDTCANNTCAPKCPTSCNADSDCAQCGTGARTSHACNNHRCSQCSATTTCANGVSCDYKHGSCSTVCGVQGTPGKCNNDADCAACKANTTHCDLPVNGGLGSCVKQANGCSDLGKGVLVMPPPFDKVTNLCSRDGDCASINADFNVGKLLRDATGSSSIKDGSFPYPMHACASVRILNKVSCGVCVPCKRDADCTPIDIDKVAGQIFGPIGGIASKILLDKIFGPSDHKVHMYCEALVDDYGVCLPCPDLLHGCGAGSGSGSSSGNSGSCDHNVCTSGGPLKSDCSDSQVGNAKCASDVCAADPDCCTAGKQWSQSCVSNVDRICDTTQCTDNCANKADGWYCSVTTGGYRCSDHAIAEGSQCASGKYCWKDDKSNVNSKAQLDSGTNKPKCNDSPQ